MTKEQPYASAKEETNGRFTGRAGGGLLDGSCRISGRLVELRRQLVLLDLLYVLIVAGRKLDHRRYRQAIEDEGSNPEGDFAPPNARFVKKEYEDR